MELNRIIWGHVLDVAPSIPNNSVSCIVTSPPYWAKRNYTGEGVVWPDGWHGQLGHEPTVTLYIQHLMQIFDEMYRILRKDGNLFVVIADTRSRGTRPKQANWEDSLRKPGDESSEPDLKPNYVQPDKSQCCVPELFKLAMMSHKWIARSTYIWVKTNPKPESVKDRFTDCFEYIYHFIKHKRYYFDIQYEPTTDGNGETLRQMRGAFVGPIQPFKGAHFATFPKWLIEPLIKAGCPTLGVVFDPFMGTGTTAVVAEKLGLDWSGIELSKNYIRMAYRRLSK